MTRISDDSDYPRHYRRTVGSRPRRSPVSGVGAGYLYAVERYGGRPQSVDTSSLRKTLYPSVVYDTESQLIEDGYERTSFR